MKRQSKHTKVQNAYRQKIVRATKVPPGKVRVIGREAYLMNAVLTGKLS